MAASPPIQTYARIAGVLFLMTFVCGGFGEAYVPMRLIVPGDATATASHILAGRSLFRLGYAGFLVESLCDVMLTWLLYLLLRPVHRDLALLAVFFRLISTAGFAAAQIFYYAALPLLGGADYLKTFSPDQLNTLMFFMMKLSTHGGALFSMHYGAGSIVLGYLIYRSTFLPRVLGVLLILSGIGFVANIFVAVLSPAYASFLFYVPTLLAVLALMIWLLAKGVDVPKWQAQAALVSD
jgi:hypothetical protein